MIVNSFHHWAVVTSSYYTSVSITIDSDVSGPTGPGTKQLSKVNNPKHLRHSWPHEPSSTPYVEICSLKGHRPSSNNTMRCTSIRSRCCVHSLFCSESPKTLADRHPDFPQRLTILFINTPWLCISFQFTGSFGG